MCYNSTMVLDRANDVSLKNREKKQFSERLDRISHDFRGPLNIINGFTDLLLDEQLGRINAEQRRALNDILQSSRKLQELVNKMFDSSSREHRQLFRRR